MKNIALKMGLLIGLCAAFTGIKGMQEEDDFAVDIETYKTILEEAVASDDVDQISNAYMNLHNNKAQTQANIDWAVKLIAEKVKEDKNYHKYNTLGYIFVGTEYSDLNTQIESAYMLSHDRDFQNNYVPRKPRLINRMLSFAWNHKKVSILTVTGLIGLGAFCYWKYKK